MQAARGATISSSSGIGASASDAWRRPGGSGVRRNASQNEGDRPRGRGRGPLLATLALLALGGYGLDRLTKHLALTRLDPQNPPSFLGGLLKLRLISNPGAAFSMGSSATVVLSLLAIAALVAVLVIAVPRVRTWVGAVACGLGLAGIAGNLTDRLTRPPGVLRGEVVDFFSLPHFAIFNVADICITVTAALLLVASLVRRDEPGDHRDGAAQVGDTPVDDGVASGQRRSGVGEVTDGRRA